MPCYSISDLSNFQHQFAVTKADTMQNDILSVEKIWIRHGCPAWISRLYIHAESTWNPGRIPMEIQHGLMTVIKTVFPCNSDDTINVRFTNFS